MKPLSLQLHIRAIVGSADQVSPDAGVLVRNDLIIENLSRSTRLLGITPAVYVNLLVDEFVDKFKAELVKQIEERLRDQA